MEGISVLSNATVHSLNTEKETPVMSVLRRVPFVLADALTQSLTETKSELYSPTQIQTDE